MDFFSDILTAIAALFEPVSHPPMSAVFIALVGLLISLMSIWATKRFSNIEQLKSDTEEVKAWQEKFKKARKTMDPVLLQEVMDSQSHIMTIQTRMMSARMKPMCIFYIPFLLIFAIMNTVYAGSVVVILPFNVHKALPFLDGWIGTSAISSGGFGMWFWSWYFLAALALGGLARRFSGLYP